VIARMATLEHLKSRYSKQLHLRGDRHFRGHRTIECRDVGMFSLASTGFSGMITLNWPFWTWIGILVDTPGMCIICIPWWPGKWPCLENSFVLTDTETLMFVVFVSCILVCNGLFIWPSCGPTWILDIIIVFWWQS